MGFLVKSDNEGGGFSNISVLTSENIPISVLSFLFIEVFKLFEKALRLLVIVTTEGSIFSVICYNNLFYSFIIIIIVFINNLGL
jgi:hypothetical protein